MTALTVLTMMTRSRAIDHVSIIGAPGPIELKKDGEDWRLVQPVAAHGPTQEQALGGVRHLRHIA